MRRRTAWLLPVLLLAGWVTSGATAQAAPSPRWLADLTYYRAAVGLPPVTEDPALSSADALHARYLAENNVLSHGEDPANPWYSPAGAAAGARSNVEVGSSNPVQAWMEGPFHALGLLAPRLTTTGFGSYTSSRGTSAAALDVLSGRSGPVSASYPVFWPGAGSTVDLTSYPGGEYPDPLTPCPGYAAPTGLPLVVQLGPGGGTHQITGGSLVDDTGHVLPVCVYDATSYRNPDPGAQATGRAVLGSYDAAVLVPARPLRPGTAYTATVAADGRTIPWSFTVGAQRAAGTDRYATAAELAGSGWPQGSGDVLLAAGEAFPDALAGGALTSRRDGPVLLTRPCVLDPGTIARLQALHPQRVTVAGGPAAICDAVIDQVRSLTGADVRRVSGSNRWGTAAALAATGWPSGAPTVFVATGLGFPDALAAAPAAGAANAPLLLTGTCDLPTETAVALRQLRPQTVVVTGGPAAVCDRVLDAIRQATGAQVQRVAGADRFATSAALAARVPAGDGALVASGTGFADALTLAAVAVHRRAPVLLVPGCGLPAPVAVSLDSRDPAHVEVAGGTMSVCDQTVLALARFVRAPTGG